MPDRPVPPDAVDPADLDALRDQLGRVPRGVVSIAARCRHGRPTVVRTAPRLEDGTPFPTTFYLTCPPAARAVSTLEAEHLMADMQARLADDAELASAYAAAHEDYLARRGELGHVEEIAGISAGGMPERVKCLHALLAHSLAVGRGVNPFGDETLDVLAARGMWSPATCTC
ncbi:DUF501 domain-containing protein [Georgenia sp. Z1491]|uniref:DUF501 domain-containing protein n=1 Tax=Georgenia sp. Z1491 TaxID=3416707 RepID=UPI003CF43600